MHKFLKSIGLSSCRTAEDRDALIAEVLTGYDTKEMAEDENHQLYTQFSREYLPDIGIIVRGIYGNDDLFHVESYFPYFTGTQVTSCPQVAIEQLASGHSYAGACDDLRVGTTLIFHLVNAVDYLKLPQDRIDFPLQTSLSLTGLAESGTILLPMKKKKDAASEKEMRLKEERYQAAVAGDPEAINRLRMDDVDQYMMIARRIQHEDVYTIVDSYFMPYGLECDFYSLMGVITSVRKERNSRSGEELFLLGVESNGLPLDICIRKEDLTGIPEVGRRFKGVIWLQGQVNF